MGKTNLALFVFASVILVALTNAATADCGSLRSCTDVAVAAADRAEKAVSTLTERVNRLPRR